MAKDLVEEVMSAPVVHVAPNATVAQALRTMVDHDIGAVVVSDAGSAIGVFTERDLTRRILDEPELLHRPVDEVMSSPVITVGPKDEIVFAFGLMTSKAVRRLPVVDGGELVGILTERDLLRWVDAVATHEGA
jgi:CBS domain-containing protein